MQLDNPLQDDEGEPHLADGVILDAFVAVCGVFVGRILNEAGDVYTDVELCALVSLL